VTSADPADTPRRRTADQGRIGRLLAFWRAWGLLVTGVWLIAVSACLLVVAVAFYSTQSATEESARVSCERSRVFGPAIANAYERFEILTPEQLEAYRQTIPTACP
jgi:hypothetical protein